jgi:tetratricopeptide (TPR) repeat protein
MELDNKTLRFGSGGSAPPPHVATMATLPAPLGATPVSAGLAEIDPKRYRVRKELARGGMGRISIAQDTILGRTVALKELLTPHGPLVGRFERELALTSRLQHPAIVSIHDGGVWPSGELVYVMKLVEGESFDRVIARHASVGERVALLPHGIAVCEAIAYAHDQGIIHRDLKPANILVGEYGETVVIDWGLAKDLRDTAAVDPELETAVGPYRDLARGAETLAGDVMGTPAYMPPEQAGGDPVDARADVYALGAVLYHLLAGVPPYSGTSAMGIVDAVLNEAPVPLDERAPGVPPDLITIVAKAMARRPEDRYATAGELARDLRRFQSGQLVGAHRYSSAQLVRRWLRKHRTAVSVAALAVVALAVGGAVSVRRIVLEQRASEAARMLADKNRALAEANSSAAEGLTTFMLTNLRDQLEPIGKQELLGVVAQRVHDYYQRQPEAHGAAAQHGRSQALRNLGDVLFAQGNTVGALADYRADLAILFGMMASRPGDPTIVRDMGVANVKIAQVLATQGETEAALGSARIGVAMLERLAEGGDARALRDLSNGLDTEAQLRAMQGDPTAIYGFRASLRAAERAAVLEPGSTTGQRAVSISHNKVGDMLLAAEDMAGAIAEYRASLAVIEMLVATDTSNTFWQRDLSISHARIGDVLLPQGDVDGALAEYRAALAIAVTLAQTDPSNADWQLDLTTCHDNVGDALRAKHDNAGALAEFEAAMAIKERLRALDPSNAVARLNLMVGHNRVGDVLLDTGNAAGALAHYRTSLELATALAADDPASRDAKLDIGKVRARLGNALLATHAFEDALVQYRADLALRTELAAADPSRPDLQRGPSLAQARIDKALDAQRVASAPRRRRR